MLRRAAGRPRPRGPWLGLIVGASLLGLGSRRYARHLPRFVAAYDKLTAACNTCHQSANRPFIVIQRPTASAFPNQSFAPKQP